MTKLQNAIVGGVRAVIGHVPASWLPGGTPDPLIDKRVALGTQPVVECGVERDRPLAGLRQRLTAHEPRGDERQADGPEFHLINAPVVDLVGVPRAAAATEAAETHVPQR